MKKVQPINPKILVERVELSTETESGIILPGNENMHTVVSKVVKVSEAAIQRGIKEGDFVITQSQKNLQVPAFIQDDNKVDFNADTFEIVDPAQIIAVYRDEDE